MDSRFTAKTCPRTAPEIELHGCRQSCTHAFRQVFVQLYAQGCRHVEARLFGRRFSGVDDQWVVSLSMQHRLYFRPLPHGHGWLAPTLVRRRGAAAGGVARVSFHRSISTGRRRSSEAIGGAVGSEPTIAWTTWEGTAAVDMARRTSAGVQRLPTRVRAR